MSFTVTEQCATGQVYMRPVRFDTEYDAFVVLDPSRESKSPGTLAAVGCWSFAVPCLTKTRLGIE
jgi:hypothetical protein